MYEKHFGLSRKPFTRNPDPDFLYMSRAHEEALARLQYAVEEKEIMMLTGEIGCGKTTLTRALIDSLDEKVKVVLVLNPRLTPMQFLRVLAVGLGLEDVPRRKDALLDAVQGRIFADFEAGVTPVIIIDEAQLVPGRETFEEIRLLTNFQLDDANMLALVIVGQTEFRKRMKHRAYRPLVQRIGVSYHIGPLSREEAREYVLHRLSVAGRAGGLFTEGALEALYRHSGGIPRVINNLATAALLEGMGADADTIDEGLVEAASREIGLGIIGSPFGEAHAST